MKKILFLMFTVVFGFSVANAKTIQVAADFDYNDKNTFNIFYEFKYNTKIANFLASHFDLVDIFYDYFKDASSVERLEHISSNATPYYIQIRKIDGNYSFELNFKDNSVSSYYKYIILTDENCNVLDTSTENNPDFSRFNFNTNKRISILECYDLFSYWQGNYDILMSEKNAFALEAYFDEGNKYTNSNMSNINPWQQFWKAVYSYFDKGNENDLDNGVNLSYFSKHLIISKFVPLAYVKNAFFNIPDYDLSDYRAFFLNEIEEGALLVPIYNPATVTDVDTNLYFFTSQTSGNFLATALNVNAPTDDSSYYSLGDNYEYLNKDYFFYNTVINLHLEDLFTKISKENVYNYAYHFFTTTYNCQVALYYNPTYFTVLPAGFNEYARFQDKGFLGFNRTQASSSWNKVNQDVGGLLGSLGNINPSYSGSGKPSGGSNSGTSSGSAVNGSNVNNLLNNFNPKDIIGNLNGIFSTMVIFINDFLDTFPDGIRMSIYFFFIMALGIAIVKLLV